MSNIRSLSDLKKEGSGGKGGGNGGMPPGMPPMGSFGSNFSMSKNVKVMRDGQLDSEIRSAGGKLVVVYFTAVWCGPCQMIAPIFSDFAEKYFPNVIFLKVDVDQCRETASQYQISTIPTFILFKNGSKIDQMGPEIEKLKTLIDTHSTPTQSSGTFPGGGYVLGNRSQTTSNIDESPTQSSQSEISPNQTTSAPVSQQSSSESVNPVLLQNLMEMGFSSEQAEKGLRATGGGSLELALDWCFSHPENESGNVLGGTSPPPRETPKETEKENQSEDKMDIDEQKPTESAPPKRVLTQEEKKQLLQEKIQRAREQKEKDEQERERQREITRRKMGQETVEAKKKWEQQQLEREAMLKRKQKEEDRKAKEMIRKKLEQDKRERQAAKQAAKQGVSATPASPQSTPPTKKEYKEAFIQIRLMDGNTIKASFKPTDLLRSVHDHVELLTHSSDFSLMTTFPRKKFTDEELNSITLQQADLVPTGTIVVTKNL